MISNCSASGGGGAIEAMNGGRVDIRDSTISGNITERGGAVSASATTVTVINSTLSGNIGSVRAGAISAFDTNVHLNLATVSGNSSPDGRGAVYIDPSSNLSIRNSIIANSSGDDCEVYLGSVRSVNNNIVESPGDCVFSGPAVMQVDPKLGPLEDNGGPTFTHALLERSPAIDAGAFGPSDLFPIYDQRKSGYPRVFNGTVEIGAFESRVLPKIIFGDGFE